MKQLEQIVGELESGELSLEKALQKFEEGVKLSKSCTEKLDTIEQKVTLLLKDHAGNEVEQPFMDDSPDDF